MTRPSTLAKTTPPSSDDVVLRERLFDLIDTKRRAPIVWVSGPPGSGKTALLASYIAVRNVNYLWYQVDRGDSDLASFYYVLADALAGDRGEVDLPLFTSEYHADAGAFARSFFQVLFDGLGTPFVLVLDNYHELLPRSGVHAALREAVQLLPPGCSLVAASRADPPPAMVRMRANRQLELIGWAALRLSQAESHAIANRWHPEMDATILDRVYGMTEGWAAALVLTLEQHASDDLWSIELGQWGQPQLIFDYLAGELLDGLPDAFSDVLLRTAFLPDITAAMASELTGIAQAGELLARIHRANQLISLKLGSDGARYQCHPLLQEYLRQRARMNLGDEQCQALLHASASVLERENRITEAAVLYAEIGDLNAVQRLILAHAGAALAQGRAETVEEWIALLPAYADDVRIPADGLASRGPVNAVQDRPSHVVSAYGAQGYSPWLTFWLATCKLQRAPHQARRLFERALLAFESELPADRSGRLLTCSAAMDAIIYELDDFSQLDRWISVVEAELATSAVIEDPEIRARLTVSMLIALVFRRPDAESIPFWAERALSETQAIGDTNVRMSAQLLVAINLNYTGQFSRVRRFIDDLQVMCSRPQVPPLVLTTLKAVESMYYMLTADHARCSAAVEAGIDICRRSGVHVWSFHLLSNGVAGALGAGDLAAADQLLAKMGEFSATARRLDRVCLHYFQAWRAALGDDLAAALVAQKKALALSIEAGCPFYEALCRISLAQLLAESDDATGACKHLSVARRIMRRVQNKWFEFMGFMVLAGICQRLDRPGLLLLALRHGLQVGREFGFKHFLWWQPGPMASLCALALDRGIESAFVVDLIQHRKLVPPHDSPADWPWPIRITTLGDFQIVRNGEILRFNRAQKPIALLKLLIAMGGRDVSEQALAAALWPNVDVSYARNSLNTNLSRLRKLLMDDQVVTVAAGLVQLDLSHCWVDSLAFCREVGQAQVAVTEAGAKLADGAAGPSLLERAGRRLVSAYAGDFLANSDSDMPIIARRRKVLREMLTSTALALAGRLECSGHRDGATRVLSDCLASAPLAEAVCAALVDLLLRNGQTSLAAESLHQHAAARKRAGVNDRTAVMEALYARVIEHTDLL